MGLGSNSGPEKARGLLNETFLGPNGWQGSRTAWSCRVQTEEMTKMGQFLRKTGVDVIGEVPWGTHFCLLYRRKEDLIERLVPYLKAGLENNEFCICVTSEQCRGEEVKEAMRKAVPDFDRYLEKGQTEWYLKDAKLSLQNALDAWPEKCDRALAEGYAGTRVTADTTWLENADWKGFADYEEEVNTVIDRYRLLACCTYALDRCGSEEVIDVCSNHEFCVVERDGKWVLIEGASPERKRTEKRLQQVSRLESIGRLAGGVAHDFNNILTGIMGLSQFLLKQMEKDSAMCRDLTQIGELAIRAADLTHQLLAFSRVQTLEPIVLNLNEAVSNISKMLQRLIGEDIELQFVPAPELGNVRADPTQIEQVVMNLAVNARDAMPAGGKLTIETENMTLDEQYARSRPGVTPGPYVMLAVTDTGCGIDAATQDRIFEPFFTTKEIGEGTGLGLATVYGIVKQHGGNIWVYSELGKGTTFKVYLPRVTADAETLLAKKAKGPTPVGTEAIVVVEDEDTVRLIAERALQELGYSVLAASNIHEAEHVFTDYKKNRVNLLVTDVVLPDGSGRELYERLEAAYPALKVLYVSGYTNRTILDHGILEEGVHFLQKPFTPERLAMKIREVLDAEGDEDEAIQKLGRETDNSKSLD